MRFNAAGDGATGVAGGAIAINGTTPAALVGVVGGGGSTHGPSWLTPTKIVYQSGGVGGVGPWVFESYDTGTLARATVDANPNNDCAAGLNVWATYLASSPTVLKSNNGIGTVSGAGLGDVSQDAGQLVKINTFPNAIGLTIYSAGGVVLVARPTNVLTSSVVRMRGGIAAFQDNGAWILQPVAGTLTYASRIQEPVNWITPLVLADGTALVLERSNRLTLRYARNGSGWVIVAEGVENQFNPDLIEISAGVVRIGWCINSGESPDSLHLAEVAIATNQIRYATSFTAGVPNWGASAALPPVTFPVGPAGSTSNGGTGVDVAGLVVPYQSAVLDKNTPGLISKPYYRWAQTVSQVVQGLGQTVAAIPPSTAGNPGTNNVTASAGPLTLNQIVLGNAASDVKALGTLGTTTTVLHGNAAGVPAFSAVALAADVSGRLPFANLVAATAGGILAGRTSAGAGDFQEISLSADLAMATTTLGLAAGRILVFRTSTTIADAAIKTLPTTPVQLVAAPGGGFRIVLLQCDVEIKIVGGYTNRDANAYLVLALSTNEVSNYIANDATTTPVLTGVNEFLNTNARSNVNLVPFSQTVTPASQQWGNVAIVKPLNFDNMALNLKMSNGASGNLTGGNAGNSMVLHTYYFVEAVLA